MFSRTFFLIKNSHLIFKNRKCFKCVCGEERECELKTNSKFCFCKYAFLERENNHLKMKKSCRLNCK